MAWWRPKPEKKPNDPEPTVEVRVRQLELAFFELQDKVYRWMQRSVARRKDGVPSSNGEPPPRDPWARHPVVQRIRARRARVPIPNGQDDTED